MSRIITPEGIASLAQLNYLRLQNFDNKLAWREVDVDLRGPYDAMMQQRYENRGVSMQQLEHDIRKSETRSRLSTVEIAPREFLAAERGTQKVVLEGLEAAVSEEKRFFELSNKGHRFSTVATSRRQQLVNWDPKTVRSMEALRLVLNFRGKTHARRMARVAATMQRAVHPDFPPELLIQVLEHNILPQHKLLRWRVDHTSSLETATEKTLAWPPDTPQNTRSRLSQAAEIPFLASALIELPIAALFPNPKSPFTIPHALTGNEHRVRHLVLDLSLPISPKPSPNNFFKCQRLQALDQRLQLLSASLPTLTRLFSNLTTCAVSILLDDPYTLISSYLDMHLNRSERNPFNLLLHPHNIEDLRPTVVSFLTTFAKLGPGKHKLVRFAVQNSRDAAAGVLHELGCENLKASEALQSLIVEEDESASDQEDDSASEQERSVSTRSEADRIFDGAFAQCRFVGVRSVV